MNIHPTQNLLLKRKAFNLKIDKTLKLLRILYVPSNIKEILDLDIQVTIHLCVSAHPGESGTISY